MAGEYIKKLQKRKITRKNQMGGIPIHLFLKKSQQHNHLMH
jgi:hypothetical protein